MRLWLTMKTVPASSRISAIRFWARSLNCASPVASASSMTRMSGTVAVEIANRSRAPIPLE